MKAVSVIALVCTLVALATSTHVYVHQKGGVDSEEFVVTETGKVESLVAVEFLDLEATQGFASLTVEMDPTKAATLSTRVMYLAAGFGEGFATAELIEAEAENFNDSSPIYLDSMKEFIIPQWKYMVSLASEASDLDAEYKKVIVGAIAQVEGMWKGYTLAATNLGYNQLSFEQFIAFQYNGDGSAIDLALNPQKRHNITSTPAEVLHAEHHFRTHCSAFVKFTKNAANEDELVMAHATWDSFQMMLRIAKTYRFPNAVGGDTESFSSSPGFIVSVDDFYTVKSIAAENTSGVNLIVTETTNGIIGFAADMYDLIVPTTLPYWIRVRAANRLASTGMEWTSLFAVQNSGTYNNQWMIADVNAVRAKADFGVLVVAEQMPASLYAEDVSSDLASNGFWSSYNIPYFAEVRDACGFTEAALKSDSFSYTKCPRGQLFPIFGPKVHSESDVAELIRRNHWKTDLPAPDNVPYAAIASRFDLADPKDAHFACFGAVDAKYAGSAKKYDDGHFHMQSGPTHDSVDTPAFKWSNSTCGKKVHSLIPDTMDFGWTTHVPAIPMYHK